MSLKKSTWTDEKTEKIVGNLLRMGVIISAAVVLFGGIIYLFHHGATIPDLHRFHSEPKELRSISGIVVDAFSRDSRGVIQLGLLLLIATPVARVIFSVIAFILQRDYTYVLVTLIVLGVLLYSLTLGRI